jgi:hypothetical protein
MAAIHLPLLPGLARHSATPCTVTLSATVQDPDANPRGRKVYLYPENNLQNAMAVADSDPATGAVSFTVPGFAATRWAMVTQGEVGENCVVHTHLVAD